MTMRRHRHYSLITMIALLGSAVAVSAALTACWEQTTEYIDDEINENEYIYPPLWSQDGQYIVVSSDRRTKVIEIESGDVYHFPHGDVSLQQAGDISSRGEILLTTYRSPGPWFWSDSDYEIEAAQLDGSNRRRITKDHDRHAYYPVWSPDEERIAFVSHAYVDTPIGRYSMGMPFTVDRDGSNLRFYTLPVELALGRLNPPSWSPDGKYLAMLLWDDECLRTERQDDACPAVIHLFDTQTGEVIRVSESVSQPSWSSDGVQLAFVKYEGGAESIVIASVESRELTRIWTLPKEAAAFPLTALERRMSLNPVWQALKGRWLSWSPDGNEIRLHRSPFVVVHTDGSGGSIMHAPDGLQAAWSSDDSKMAVYASADELGRQEGLVIMNRDASDKKAALGALTEDLQVLKWVSLEGRSW